MIPRRPGQIARLNPRQRNRERPRNVYQRRVARLMLTGTMRDPRKVRSPDSSPQRPRAVGPFSSTAMMAPSAGVPAWSGARKLGGLSQTRARVECRSSRLNSRQQAALTSARTWTIRRGLVEGWVVVVVHAGTPLVLHLQGECQRYMCGPRWPPVSPVGLRQYGELVVQLYGGSGCLPAACC